MAGDVTNARLWRDADVYVGPTDATNPADVDTVFGGDWDLVGLLDGEAGFVQSRDEETDDFYAWGGVLVRTSRRNFKLTVTFTALESNETTKALLWPNSEPGEIAVPRPVRQKIGFETREGETVHRLITKHEAEIVLNADLTESESELTKYEFIATIYPDADGVLFVEQETEVASA